MRGMPDDAAGAAIKAILEWMGGNEPGDISAASSDVYMEMRGMVELCRKRSSAGKAGGDRKRLDAFSVSKQVEQPKMPQEVPPATPPIAPANKNTLLAGLAAFG